MTQRPVLLWWPGATVAVSDVAAGLAHGLHTLGVDIVHYRTDAHLESAGSALLSQWKRRVKQDKTLKRPTEADILYIAAQGVLTAALRYQPSWVFVVCGMYQHPDFVVFLKRAGLKVALVCTESPYAVAEELNLARFVDHVFTNERTVTPLFKTVNRRVTYLPHAWHPGVHGLAAADDEGVRAHDVVYVGTGFIERVRQLQAMNWDGIDFGLYGTWSLVPARSKLRRHIVAGDIQNTVTAALYRKAKVGLNLHRTAVRWGHDVPHVQRAESLNPRCYELAACQTFFTTDRRAEVRDVFGDALPTYDSPASAEAVIRRALHEPAWRADVAAACYQAVQPHTWTARAEAVLAALDGQTVEVAA